MMHQETHSSRCEGRECRRKQRRGRTKTKKKDLLSYLRQRNTEKYREDPLCYLKYSELRYEDGYYETCIFPMYSKARDSLQQKKKKENEEKKKKMTVDTTVRRKRNRGREWKKRGRQRLSIVCRKMKEFSKDMEKPLSRRVKLRREDEEGKEKSATTDRERKGRREKKNSLSPAERKNAEFQR